MLKIIALAILADMGLFLVDTRVGAFGVFILLLTFFVASVFRSTT
ncbi:MAG: hypothetical protein OQK07_09170 [Rhodospirillales bacterium]|nr:hypothetical protein [Rhodospirillales bacterium]